LLRARAVPRAALVEPVWLLVVVLSLRVRVLVLAVPVLPRAPVAFPVAPVSLRVLVAPPDEPALPVEIPDEAQV
jgi:hypothetical protein